MRRFLVVSLTLAVIFGLFIIPGSAVVQPNHFYIPFNGIGLSLGDLYVSLPISLSDVDGYDASPTGTLLDNYAEYPNGSDVAWQIGGVTKTSSYTDADFYISSYSDDIPNVAYSLLADEFFIARGALSNSLMIVPQGDDATLTHRYRITGRIRYIERGDSGYTTQYASFDTNYNNFVNGVDINAVIRNALPASVSNLNVLYFEYLTVIIDNQRTDPSQIFFTLRGSGTAVSLSSYDAWYRQFDMKYITVVPADPSDGNFVSWASSAIETVFKTELFHGITLNEIITFGLIFGLVFWFLKLTV